jgi:hypothetical protein
VYLSIGGKTSTCGDGIVIPMNNLVFRKRNAATTFSVERLLVACSIIAAFAIMAVALTFASLSTDSHNVAGCTMTRSGTSSSMVCSPDTSSSGIAGAPTQQEITAKNAQRARSGLGGLF